MNPEANQWKNSLDEYRYAVNTSDYEFRDDHEGWFERELGKGDREETVRFEDYFRQHAPCALEPWFEVIFWKLASQNRIRNGTTQRIAKNLTEKTTAGELWHK